MFSTTAGIITFLVILFGSLISLVSGLAINENRKRKINENRKIEKQEEIVNKDMREDKDTEVVDYLEKEGISFKYDNSKEYFLDVLRKPQQIQIEQLNKEQIVNNKNKDDELVK